MAQTTDTILMIEPVKFGYNEQTAVNNYYQIKSEQTQEIQDRALKEFSDLVKKLRSKGINVIVVKDMDIPHTPDSIFPNNWVSFHQNANIGLYPMYAKNRRQERREDIFLLLQEKGFYIEQIIDYSSAEKEHIFLEGTGSIILDREHRYAYLALSDRSDKQLFIKFCEDFKYMPVVFTANQTIDEQRVAIYHTNVMMCIADRYAVICLDCIDDKNERKNVIEKLQKTDKEIITITEDQVNTFAGNMLQVQNINGNKFIVMSNTAYESLTHEQVQTLQKYNSIINSNLNTIQTNGGGSARCMMAEVFLPKL